jgi:hypothetical protein
VAFGKEAKYLQVPNGGGDSYALGLRPAGGTMRGLFPGWPLTVAWLILTGVLATLYFSPIGRLIVTLIE